MWWNPYNNGNMFRAQGENKEVINSADLKESLLEEVMSELSFEGRILIPG